MLAVLVHRLFGLNEAHFKMGISTPVPVYDEVVSQSSA